MPCWGGETAEMPGVYEPGAVDLVGTIIGVVDRGRVIDGSHIQAGDVILGLPSTGLHTNGYSLARKVLADLDWRTPHPTLGQPIGEALLTPHRAYLDAVQALGQAGVDIHGLAHITGGGLIDNPPRIFPDGLGAIIHRGSWPILPIFDLIQQTGHISDAEMAHVFNLGLGMLVIIPAEQVAAAQSALSYAIFTVGEMVPGPKQVSIFD